jgi:hypothetical protein
MKHAIREQRTISVTQLDLSPVAKAALSELSQGPYYPHLLDLMERACIEMDTALINTPAADPEAVLGAHAISAAAWKFFTYIQRAVQNAHNQHTAIEPEPPEPPSEEDRIQGIY